MRRTFQIAFAMVLALVFIRSSIAADLKPGEKIQLKLNLPKGDKKSVSANVDMDMHMSAGGQKVEMKNKALSQISLQVQDIDSQGAETIEVVNKRMKLDMAGGPVTMSYDSDKPEDAKSAVGQMMGAMIGKPIVIKFASNGKPQEIVGLDKVLEEMKAKASPQAAGTMEAQIKGMKDSMGQTMAPLPEQPVGIGDTWKSQFKMPGGGPDQGGTIDATYTLKDVRDGTVFADLDGAITINSVQQLKGTCKGQVEIDQKTGWTKKTDMTMKLSGKQGTADISIDGKVTSGSN